MRALIMVAGLLLVSGCSSHGVVHYSPYDLDRDGVMDARCPGMEYDTSKNTLYGWRSRASGDCADQAPMKESS